MKTAKTLVFAAGAFATMCGLGARLSNSAGVGQEPSAPVTMPTPQLFKERGCSHCHMLNGDGGRKGPNLTDVGGRLKADAIRRQILEGGGAMPSYQDALSAGEVDALVAMLREARAGKHR